MRKVIVEFVELSLRVKFSLLIIFFSTLQLNAQDLELFDLKTYERANKEIIAFISLSDIYPLSEHPDSLAIPDLREEEEGQAKEFEYLVLNSYHRNQFLKGTKISDTDSVFIYSYSGNKLISLPMNSLKSVACLNIYGADWPYTQADYMIGFEIDKKFLLDFEKSFVNTLVYVGKENPFVLGQLKKVLWKKIDNKEGLYSSGTLTFDTSYTGKIIPGNIYEYENDSMLFVIQEYFKLIDSRIGAKHLVIMDVNRRIIFEKLYYSGESASFAPLDNQWTGKLFKDKPHVIFGFHWVSFGCPGIAFLNPAENEIFINCDNRH